ncbi:hypothetical protein GCM10027051_20120 [Niabella terrae]
MLLTVVSLQALEAQTVDSTLAIADSTDATTGNNDTKLILATILASGIDYYGQTTEKRLPYLALNSTLFFKPGIYLGLTGFHLWGDSMLVSATGLTAGYERSLCTALTADISYTYTRFPEQSPFLQASSPHTASLEFKWTQVWMASLGLDYSFGKAQRDVFTSGCIGRTLSLSPKAGHYELNIVPQLTVIAGTQQFYRSYLETVQRNNQGQGQGQPPPKTTEVSQSFNSFGLLSYNFKAALSYSRSSYLVELSPACAVLGNNTIDPGKVNAFITLSAYYQF